MNKTDTMKATVGGYLDSSLGVRETATTGSSVDSSTVAQFAGRIRHKSACTLNLDRVMPDPDQPRKHFAQEELEQLSHSLKTKGQLQPIRVRWDESRKKYVIICGERRFRAATLAGFTQIDAIVHEGTLDEAELFELQLIENCIRTDLNPIEQAQAFSTLLEKKKCSARSLAEELRVNVSTISRSLSLLKLPAEIQNHLTKGTIPPGVAREIVKLSDPAKQMEFVERYLAGGLTSADMAAEVSESKGTKAAPPGTKKTITVPLGLKITVAGKKRHSNTDILEALKQAVAIVENETKGRAKKAA